jgi:hypothetical protein
MIENEMRELSLWRAWSEALSSVNVHAADVACLYLPRPATVWEI